MAKWSRQKRNSRNILHGRWTPVPGERSSRNGEIPFAKFLVMDWGDSRRGRQFLCAAREDALMVWGRWSQAMAKRAVSRSVRHKGSFSLAWTRPRPSRSCHLVPTRPFLFISSSARASINCPFNCPSFFPFCIFVLQLISIRASFVRSSTLCLSNKGDTSVTIIRFVNRRMKFC